MARGKKTGGRNIQKGQVLNPLGGGGHCRETARLRALTRMELAEIGSMVVGGDTRALRKIEKDPNETVLRKWFAKVALNALTSGDSKHFNVLLDRIVGKATEVKEISGPDGSPLIPKTPEQREANLGVLLGVLGKLDPNGKP